MSSENELKLRWIMDFESEIHHIQDFDVLLERVLTESRKLLHADAGAIYECDGNSLKIKYAQNDTLQARLKAGENLPFRFFSLPIDNTSFAGYSVKSFRPVNIDNAYEIPIDSPYSFNKRLDEISGYRTVSVLTTPIVASTRKILGVLEVINARDDEGNIIPFDSNSEFYFRQFASTTSQALERAYLTRMMVMRLIEMSRYRDPKETGSHVSRVSNYAIEMYDRWAFTHKINTADAEKFRDTLKIAATLHDVGKVGIPDHVLKKPGKFTDKEFEIIKGHTRIGAQLFSEVSSGMDIMSREVALRHHERWDGNGYPGHIDLNEVISGETESSAEIVSAQGLKGEEIPFAARIVSVADVFDALCSKRVYKDAWSVDEAVTEIYAQSGKQFDPDVVEAFAETLPQIKEIYNAFPEAV